MEKDKKETVKEEKVTEKENVKTEVVSKAKPAIKKVEPSKVEKENTTPVVSKDKVVPVAKVETTKVESEKVVPAKVTDVDTVTPIELTKKSSEEKELNNELSERAVKWKSWLKLHGITPEKFLEKYPNHNARAHVEELTIENKK